MMAMRNCLSRMGWFFLVRGANCLGNGTYDSGSPGQVAPRDAGIAASGGDLPAVEPPVLFVWGSGEFWVDDAARERQRALMPDRYTELEVDAGHFLIDEQEAQVVDAVLAHVRSAQP